MRNNKIKKFDAKKFDSISKLINNSKYNMALRELKEYIEEYPRDDLGLLMY